VPRFPNPMYSKWFSEYHKIHADVQVNYQPIGSGGGIRQVTVGHSGLRGQRYAHEPISSIAGLEDEDPEYPHRVGRGGSGL
jgi:hypothetical protein